MNTKNVGAVVDRSVEMDYYDILSIVAERECIILTKDNIGRFLFENGYIGRSKNEMLDKIVKNAMIIRERK